MTRSFIPLIVLLASGCASTPEVRGLADKTGLFVTSVNAGTAEFIESQNRLNQANAARLDRLVLTASPDRSNVRQHRLAWTDAGQSDRLALLESATARDADDIVAGLTVKRTSAARVAGGAAEGYAKSLKSLAETAAKPKASAALRELLAFGQDVYTKYGELKKEAQDAAESTEQEAAAVDSQTQASATAVPD